MHKVFTTIGVRTRVHGARRYNRGMTPSPSDPLYAHLDTLGMSGLLYAVGAGGLSLLFTASAIRVWRDESERSARQMFAFSLAYLFLIFVLLLADRAIGAWR